MNDRIREINKRDMQKVKKWLSDPDRVLYAFNIFMAGALVGYIVGKLMH